MAGKQSCKRGENSLMQAGSCVPCFTLEIRVKYADTDKMQYVYYGRYYEYFEAARNEMLREIGFEYKQLEALGVMLPVVTSHADYSIPARYDDLLVIHTKVKALENVRIAIGYEVTRKDESKILATGYTMHAFINKQGRPVRPPNEFKDALAKAGIK